MKFLALFISLVLIVQPAFAQEKESSEQLYQEAYENFVKRDYTSASAALDKINPVDQKKADVLNLRGAIYKRMGELDNAANAYNDALKINPKDWVPKYNLAEVNFLRGQYKPSRTFLEQALASMPEADRLQKQDLILYKVYLTYLLQGDEEKAKLLLDSFDVNSSNPVYYFAQAAWSYKKKDVAKAKTWVTSTEGLYSQELRSSYSQALVDVGWLEPAEGVVVTNLTANPAATATPAASGTPAIAAASPPAASGENTIVPLATNDATPITVAETAATPTATPDALTTSTMPEPTALANADKGKSFPVKTALIALVVLALAAFVLINLGKQSRIVPPPEDNTGYDAIAASGSADAAGSIAYTSEGTGVVLEQDESGNVAPAAIRPTPIHRDYSEATTSSASTSEKPKATPATRTRRSAAPALKLGSDAPVKALAATTAKAPATRKKSIAKPASAKSGTPAPVEPAPVSPIAPVTKSRKKPASAESAVAKTTAPKAAAKSTAAAPRRTRLVPIPTADVPPPAVAPAKLMVSNIEVLPVDPTKPIPAPAPVPAKTPKPKAAKPKAATRTPASSAPKPASSLITIPEFEDPDLTTPAPTIRLTPQPENGDDSKV